MSASVTAEEEKSGKTSRLHPDPGGVVLLRSMGEVANLGIGRGADCGGLSARPDPAFGAAPVGFHLLYGSDRMAPPDVEKKYLQVMKESDWPNPSVASAGNYTTTGLYFGLFSFGIALVRKATGSTRLALAAATWHWRGDAGGCQRG